MELYEAIEKRRTIRVFRKGASEDQLKKIMLAAPRPLLREQPALGIHSREGSGTIEKLSQVKCEQTRAHPPKRVEGDPEAIEKLAQAQKDSFRNASIVAVCHRIEWSEAFGCAWRTCPGGRDRGAGERDCAVLGREAERGR